MTRESVLQFGEGKRLAGILSEPGDERRNETCVLVTAGLTPKFGPFRLYTELARRLARDGFRTLRFDLGGLGDSRAVRADLRLRQRTELDLSDAVEAAARTGDVILIGLCSGAEDAFRYAETDTRVTGVVLIDPFAYETPGWNLRNTAFRLRRRALRGLGLYRPVEGAGGGLIDYQYMERPESRRILERLVARGTNVHFVYTGGCTAFNHPAQLAAMFEGLDFQGRVTLDHLPSMDHTQPLAEDRFQLIEAVAERLVEASDGSSSAVGRSALYGAASSFASLLLGILSSL